MHTTQPTLRSGVQIALLAASLFAFPAEAATPIPTLPDPNLQTCLSEEVSRHGWQFVEDVVSLGCSGRGVVSVTDLEVFGELTDLDLSNNAIADVENLRYLHRLTRLNLSGNTAIPVAQVRNILDANPGITRLGLNGITIGNFNNLGNLANVYAPYNLVELDLGNTSLFDPYDGKSTAFLHTYYKLTVLNLAGNGFTDAMDLSSLDFLTNLDLSNNAIADVENLRYLHRLTRLNLSGNTAIPVAQVRNILDANPGITRLGLNGITIGNFNNLGNLANVYAPYNLVELDLGNTSLSDPYDGKSTQFINTYYNLTALNLAGNGFIDAMYLEGLEFLTDLDLSNNAIADVENLRYLHRLTRLNLSGNTAIPVAQVRNILDANPGITHLGLNGITIGNFNNLGNLANVYAPYNLVELDLGNTSLFDPYDGKSTAFLHTYYKLTVLNLAGNGFTDAMDLSSLDFLTNLDLSNNAIADVENLRYLHRLTRLNLSGNTAIPVAQVRNILDANPGITHLGLNGITIGNFNNLGNLANVYAPYNLVELDLGNTSLFDPYDGKSTQFINTYYNLTALNLAGNGFIDAMYLEGLEFLTDLDLSNNAIADVENLRYLHRLTRLNLSGNTAIPVAQVRNILDANPGITRLGLNGITIGNFNNLGNLANVYAPYNLVELDLGNTSLFDPYDGKSTAFLHTYYKLTVLNLAGNGFTDAMDLSSLDFLTNLDLSNNAIADVENLRYLHRLTRLNLSGNTAIPVAQVRDILDANPGITRLGLNGITIGNFNNLGNLANVYAPYNLVELDLGNTSLFDPYDGKSTAFLHTYYKLTVLNLAGNGFTDAMDLSSLDFLTNLDLSNNAIADILPLASLERTLKFLNLLGNNAIPCTDLDNLILAMPGTLIQRPVSCWSPNQLPIADAGGDQTAIETALVTLAGSGVDPDGSIVAYQWTQVAGPSVTLTASNSPTASFTAPWVSADTPLEFQLAVTDDAGSVSMDTSLVTVQNVSGVDLVVTSLSGAPASIKRGSKFVVTATTKNAGNLNTTTSTSTGIFLSTDANISASDTRIGVANITSLRAGASVVRNLTVTVPKNLAPGTYYLGGVADYASRQGEISEGNNGILGASIVVTQ